MSDWVKYQRVECKEGFIDVWYGDSANNPNNDEEMSYCLNTMKTFFRLNGKDEWIESSSFNNYFKNFLCKNKENMTSNEIWNQYLKN